MPKALSRSAAKRGHKTKLIVRLLVPMLALLLFQILASFAVLILGGEFSYVRQYAFGTLIEKTENRKSYIESDFQQKMPTVLETSEKITAIVEEILDERIGSISDITKDNALNRDIMEAVLDNIVDMLRRSNSNDAYIILETGELYKDANTGKTGKAALYLRDLDAASDAGFEDLLLEVGFSSISRDFGITMDSGWKLHFEPDPNDLQSYGFYYNTLKTAKEHPGKLENLGYWSSFSRPSRAAAESIKYTVPLIWSDGTVYGVVGIGLTENTLLSNLPANDFLSETACYVLGKGSDDNRFDIIMHSGTAFGKLVQNAQSLALAVSAEDGVYGFSDPPNAGLSGSVQYMTLYNQTSPYYGEKWALISIADTDSVLSPLNSLIRMLVIASAVSLGISVVVVILICRAVTKPISSAIKTMNSNSDYNKVIRFSPSNIYELDSMTDAITQLQINVQDFSSQVSQMIRIADVGLGTFMYDRSDGSVFVGQSLLKLLNFDMDREEDVLMSGDVFLDSIAEPETRAVIDEGMALALKDASSDYEKEYSIEPEDGSTVWMRLSLVHNKDKSIGILQDITGEMMEKQRIEYERDYDGTTGLLNRKAFYRRLEELFRERDKLGVTAMLMMDLDNLKYVNDTYGHDFGDDYIKTAATTLKLFRDYGGVISRLSGDEFCVCLPGFDSKEEILKIVGDIRQQLLSSYCLLADGTHFKIRASAGLSWYPDDAVSQEMLMKYADFAMYTVKHSTKGELAQFDKNAYDKDSVLLTGVEEMERIIDECSIKYAFHSIVNAHTGEIYGYEALMRPQSTVLQSPLDLLRIAKTGARLAEIEKLTWSKGLFDFKAQIDAGRVSPDCHVFVNSISNVSLDPADANAIEEQYPELLGNIVLEILEGEAMNEEYTARKLARMKKWNAQVALDDFGTGYNNEFALITIQPNIIKIDRSIISGCDKDISRRTIISNLVKLVRSKEIKVLAEGVETEDELKTVIACGVDLLQGYYINRPVFEPEPLPKEITATILKYNEK